MLCRNSVAFESAPRGSKSLMMMALAAHERHAIHPGFLDRGIVASRLLVLFGVVVVVVVVVGLKL
jgi:hypothetical protein